VVVALWVGAVGRELGPEDFDADGEGEAVVAEGDVDGEELGSADGDGLDEADADGAGGAAEVAAADDGAGCVAASGMLSRTSWAAASSRAGDS
jgi:hypothetical protein